METFDTKLLSNQATARCLLSTAEEYVHSPLFLDYEAEMLLRRAIHYDPMLIRAYHLLGFVLERQLRWDEAIEVFNTIKQFMRWRADAHELTRNGTVLPDCEPQAPYARQRSLGGFQE